MIKFTQKEISLLLFIIQDYYTKNSNNIKTRDEILNKLRKEVKYD